MARIDEYGERIPLTVADFNVEQGTVTVVIQAVGKTTFEMLALARGRLPYWISSVRLDSPATFASSKAPSCMVGGGLGVAPVYPQLREYKLTGNRTISIVGFRSKDLVFWEDKFRDVSDELIVTTDDGTYGRKGFVTHALADVLSREKDVREVVAIGPIPMMKACCETTRPFAIPTVVSLNSIMVDGTGMCGSCRVTVGGNMKFACVDGADFDGHLVNFDELSCARSVFTVKRKPLSTDTATNPPNWPAWPMPAAAPSSMPFRSPPTCLPVANPERSRPAPPQEHQDHSARARPHAAPAGRSRAPTILRKSTSASIWRAHCMRPNAACAARSRAASPAARWVSTSPASSPPSRAKTSSSPTRFSRVPTPCPRCAAAFARRNRSARPPAWSAPSSTRRHRTSRAVRRRLRHGPRLGRNPARQTRTEEGRHHRFRTVRSGLRRRTGPQRRGRDHLRGAARRRRRPQVRHPRIPPARRHHRRRNRRP